MSRSFRWILTVSISLMALLAVAAYLVNRQISARLEKTYAIPVEPIEVPTDPESIERGEHLVSAVLFCQECHGDRLQGRIYFDHPLTGRIAASNLTAGQGGVGADYTDEDWVRAIRHGVRPDGKPLIGMPSNTYAKLGERDLAAVIAYLTQLPPRDSDFPERTVGPITRLSILGDPSLIPAEVIDHGAPRPTAAEPGVTVEYGRYLAIACTVCHGEDFAGGSGAGAGLNLTAGGDLARWTEADFIRTIRTGETPAGYELDPELMPWKRVRNMSDEELRAIWLYLQTVAAVESEGG